MEIFNRFSLYEFLAHLFPGIISLTAIYCILLLTPLQEMLLSLDVNFTFSLFFFALSYVVGLVSKSWSRWIMKILLWIKRDKEFSYRDIIPIPTFEAEIKKAFKEVFKFSESEELNWTKEHYYLCRNITSVVIPDVGRKVEQEVSRKRLRTNLFLSIFLWLVTGIIWGIWIILFGSLVWGIVLIVFTLVIFYSILVTNLRRVSKTDKLEVKEVLNAFLAAHKVGMFEKGNIR